METQYKSIPDYPIYMINIEGTSVIKLCNPTLYKVEAGKVYRRKSTTNKFIELSDNKYVSKGHKVYRKISICDNGLGYKLVTISMNKKQTNEYIHRLVYKTFVGNIPENMEVDHVDSDKSNNSAGNLELLTHTDNIVKMQKLHGKYTQKLCVICGKKVYAKNSEYCTKCMPKDETTGKRIRTDEELKATIKRRKVDRPTRDELETLINNNTFVAIGRMYGVSDNSIRKWCKSYGLPYRTKQKN